MSVNPIRRSSPATCVVPAFQRGAAGAGSNVPLKSRSSWPSRFVIAEAGALNDARHRVERRIGAGLREPRGAQSCRRSGASVTGPARITKRHCRSRRFRRRAQPRATETIRGLRHAANARTRRLTIARQRGSRACFVYASFRESTMREPGIDGRERHCQRHRRRAGQYSCRPNTRRDARGSTGSRDEPAPTTWSNSRGQRRHQRCPL